MKRKICNFVMLGLLISALAIRCNTSPYTRAQANKNMAHEIAEMLRAEGHPEDHPVIVACQQWWRDEDQKELSDPSYTTREQRAEFPVASSVWQLLREAGISEVCAAGIMGNMMAEVGGHTLDLDLYARSGGYFGLCMWSLAYCPEVDGLGAPGQIAYLLDTLDTNMAVAGGSAEAFMALTDARQAARYFSDKYERPAVWSEKRADNAELALRYFGG